MDVETPARRNRQTTFAESGFAWQGSRDFHGGFQMITVFGASGNTGGAAAAHLLKVGKKVRVVGRNKDKLARFTQAGAEAAVGDVESAAFVQQALTGADAAYILIPPNMAVDDFRAYQQRLIDVYVAALEATGVRHVVLLSSIGAQHREGTGPIVALHHFENRLKKIPPLNALFLRAGFFMENVLMGLAPVKAHGMYPGPMPPDASIAMIASADIGHYAGTRLERLDFSGKSVVHLVGPKAVSQTEMVTILGQAIGKPVRYQQVSFDDVENGLKQAGLKPRFISVYMEMARAGTKGLVAPEEGGQVVQAETTFDTFAKQVIAPAAKA
jgi:uncharacterized protein YbjT (DUF2867 family)